MMLLLLLLTAQTPEVNGIVVDATEVRSGAGRSAESVARAINHLWDKTQACVVAEGFVPLDVTLVVAPTGRVVTTMVKASEPRGRAFATCVAGTLGTLRLAPAAEQASVIVSITRTGPQGLMNKDVIRRIVHEHAAQIRYCYEKELVLAPTISGKITMRWTIDGDGDVVLAEVMESSLPPAVGACLTRKILTWVFPKPKNGGIVVVNYPFVFKTTETAPAPPEWK